jgi:(d)CTP diphosphatase
MNQPPSQSQPAIRRRGVVAVVHIEERFLVIRRAAGIAAPRKFCFPGGGIEPGESEQDALRREVQEELSASARALRCIWRSVTPWGVDLAWWLCELSDPGQVVPNPAEVESVHWLLPTEMMALAELLESNRHFLDAVSAGQIQLS